MSNLKTEILKIYEFVNSEFDINDKEELEAIKEGLGLEQIEKLDIMLSDYKKAVNKAKRAEQKKQNMKNYKKAGVNLKLEEYEKYEIDATSKSLKMSEYVKKALEGFIAPKTVEADKVSVQNEINPLTARYEALKVEVQTLKDSKTTNDKNNETLKTNIEKLESEIANLRIENKKLKTVKPITIETKTKKVEKDKKSYSSEVTFISLIMLTTVVFALYGFGSVAYDLYMKFN